MAPCAVAVYKWLIAARKTPLGSEFGSGKGGAPMRLVWGQLATIFAFSVCAAAAVSAAENGAVGASYGTREPVVCASRAAPAQGAPSAAQAAQYVKCYIEGIGDGRLYLLEQVNVKAVQAGRAFDPQRDYFENIDRTQPVYPISGSLVRYACETPNARNAGKNCTAFAEDNAAGYCFKTMSAEWSCNMSDLRQRLIEGATPPK